MSLIERMCAEADKLDTLATVMTKGKSKRAEAADVIREAKAQLEAMQAEIDRLNRECEQRVQATLIAQEQAMENGATANRLRDALKPFAAMAEYLDNTEKTRDAIYCGGDPGILAEVKQSDYHRARASLDRQGK